MNVGSASLLVVVCVVGCRPAPPPAQVGGSQPVATVHVAAAGAPTAVAAPTERPPSAPRDGCESRVEDGEDGNNQLIVHEGRGGYLYTYVDPEGSSIEPTSASEGGIFTVTPGGANGSLSALRISGTIVNAEITYAGLGMNFVDPKAGFDASAHRGIAFWARRAPGSLAEVRVKLPDVNTDPDGGQCSSCYNDFGATVSLTESWQRYEIAFSDTRQEPGWGSPRPPAITPSELYSLQFQVQGTGAYDLWFDDVMFVGCAR